MKRLWAPWRIEYIVGPKPDECVLCIPPSPEKDTDHLILWRGKSAFVMMNRFPYINGHLMVSPCRHVENLTDLNRNETHEIMDLLQECIRILEKTFTPDGINVGLNTGEAAGAGIEEHLHFHVLPRWNGDHSFMAVFGETAVIPEHLLRTYNRLQPEFVALDNKQT